MTASGETAAAPCETPLMGENSSKPEVEEQPSVPPDPQPQTPPADSPKVAFKLGGSEEADLNNDMETKDLDLSNGEKIMAFECLNELFFWKCKKQNFYLSSNIRNGTISRTRVKKKKKKKTCFHRS